MLRDGVQRAMGKCFIIKTPTFDLVQTCSFEELLQRGPGGAAGEKILLRPDLCWGHTTLASVTQPDVSNSPSSCTKSLQSSLGPWLAALLGKSHLTSLKHRVFICTIWPQTLTTQEMATITPPSPHRDL